MGIKLSLFDTSTVEKTEFTLNDDDYIDIDIDDDDYVILGNNFNEKMKNDTEMIKENDTEMIKENDTEMIKENDTEMIKENDTETNEKITAEKLVDDIISNVVCEIKKKKKKKRKNNT